MGLLGHVRASVRDHPHADVAVAGVVFAVTLVTTFAAPGGQPIDAVALLTVAVASGALAGRRRAPVTVLLVSAVAAEVYLVHFGGLQGSLVLAAPLIALYTVAELTTRRRAVVIGVSVVLLFGALHIVVKPASWIGADNVALAALGGLAIAAGHAARTRRAYLAEVEARALDAEAGRDAEAARRVTEERLRIARDLHDRLGHQLTLIYVQAGLAAHVLPDPPPQAADALAHIRSASKTALSELGDTIGLLRRPDEPAAPVDPDAALARLADLLGTFRRAGLDITEHVDGLARPLPAAADAVAYRVVQEALVNVRKHAGATSVHLKVSYHPDAVRIVVENTEPAVRPEPAPPGGHGLTGLDERIRVLGGSLRTGPRPDGGFRVSAVLPLTTARLAGTR
ncbi:sensor histidine kinase [Cryptosporangium aurantiacum]|uniref:histidine kinase n=1 Tax=Cryptosporangium aurantiacum TaxID=134849 RepID=A0A1M7Q7W5_9ACTN|nr:histidine kinase [Cryptosporangium aurantiacum]SHN26512.1 Signal transduction histidine kinase [Cryptosporangium aurantiacum]